MCSPIQKSSVMFAPEPSFLMIASRLVMLSISIAAAGTPALGEPQVTWSDEISGHLSLPRAESHRATS